MDNLVVVKNIKKMKNLIEYEYEFNGKWKNLLNKDKKMFLEYNCNIEKVPDSIAMIPFICNMLPIAFVFDLDIKVNEIDEKFYNSVDDLRTGYQNMYPKIKMGGKIVYKEIINNSYENENSLCLFSGGIDAYNTLLQNIDKKPMLFTIWGADIKLDDYDGWERVKKYHIDASEKFGLEFNYVKSNFREVISYDVLSKYVSLFYDEEWWHGFQHGIGILGQVAPICYTRNIGTVFIASSFSASDTVKHSCASDPTIDNYLKFGSSHIIHDGYEFNRQQKIFNICKYVKDNEIDKLDIRVCWKSKGGKNCCECEKCYRTILGFIAEKVNPNKMGFDFTSEKYEKMARELPKMIKSYKYLCMYIYIQNSFRKNYKIEEVPDELIWFYNMKIKEKNNVKNIKDNLKRNIKYFLHYKENNDLKKIYK